MRRRGRPKSVSHEILAAYYQPHTLLADDCWPPTNGHLLLAASCRPPTIS